MKEWIKSKTIWIAGIIQSIGMGLIFIQPMIEMIPGEWGIKAVGILMILMGIQQQILRMVTTEPLTTKKPVDPEVLELRQRIAALEGNTVEERERPKTF